jgi:hypothetical protein
MLTLTYIALAVLGTGYILVSAFLGHLFEHGDDGGGDHAADHGGDSGGDSAYGAGGHGKVSTGDGAVGVFHFPFFSPLALATLFASFGAWGLIGQFGLQLSDRASVLFSLPGALITAYAVTYVGWRLVSGSQGTSLIRLADLTGCSAEVTAPIPAGGIGEALAIVRGQRYSAPARAADGGELSRGAAVTLVGMSGPTLLVQASPFSQGSASHV